MNDWRATSDLMKGIIGFWVAFLLVAAFAGIIGTLGGK